MTTPPTPPSDNLAAEGGPRSEQACDHPSTTLVNEETGWKCYDCGAILGWPATAEREGLSDLSLVLRRAAREYLGLEERDYWDSAIADAQADALADLLAARDRRVRAEALREAADAWPYEVNAETIRREIATLDLRETPPEYRVDDWLRDRADRIEAP